MNKQADALPLPPGICWVCREKASHVSFGALCEDCWADSMARCFPAPMRLPRLTERKQDTWAEARRRESELAEQKEF